MQVVKVGFDLDGVLANAVHKMNTLLGRPEAADPVWLPKTWNWLVDDFGLSSEYSKAMWGAFFSYPHLRNLDELPGLQALRQFRFDAHDLPVEYYYITNRGGQTALRQTNDWLYNHDVLGDDSTVIISPKKGELAKLLGLDFYIEDNLDNALSVTHHTGKRGYLLDAPYNQTSSPEQEAQVFRVHSVEEYLNDVRRYMELL